MSAAPNTDQLRPGNQSGLPLVYGAAHLRLPRDSRNVEAPPRRRREMTAHGLTRQVKPPYSEVTRTNYRPTEIQPMTDEDPRFFDAEKSRNQQYSRAQISAAMKWEQPDPSELADDDEFLAGVVAYLQRLSQCVHVSVHRTGDGDRHISIYDRRATDVAAPTIELLDALGFRPIHAGTKEIPYPTEGGTAYHRHGWMEWRGTGTPAMMDTLEAHIHHHDPKPHEKQFWKFYANDFLPKLREGDSDE